MLLNVLTALYAISLITNIILTPLGIYIFFKKKRILNIPLILQVTLIIMSISLFDTASTIHCFEVYKNVEIESNPLVRFIVGRVGYAGFIPLFFLETSFVFSAVCFSFFVLTHFLPKIYNFFPPKTKIDFWIHKRIEKVGQISFCACWIIITVLYINIPIHNLSVC